MQHMVRIPPSPLSILSKSPKIFLLTLQSVSPLPSPSLPLSHDIFQDPVMIKGCAHTFCRPCVTATLEGRGVTASRCPTCAHPVWIKDLFPNDLVAHGATYYAALARTLAQHPIVHPDPEPEQGQGPATALGGETVTAVTAAMFPPELSLRPPSMPQGTEGTGRPSLVPSETPGAEEETPGPSGRGAGPSSTRGRGGKKGTSHRKGIAAVPPPPPSAPAVPTVPPPPPVAAAAVAAPRPLSRFAQLLALSPSPPSCTALYGHRGPDPLRTAAPEETPGALAPLPLVLSPPPAETQAEAEAEAAAAVPKAAPTPQCSDAPPATAPAAPAEGPDLRTPTAGALASFPKAARLTEEQRGAAKDRVGTRIAALPAPVDPLPIAHSLKSPRHRLSTLLPTPPDRFSPTSSPTRTACEGIRMPPPCPPPT